MCVSVCSIDVCVCVQYRCVCVCVCARVCARACYLVHVPLCLLLGHGVHALTLRHSWGQHALTHGHVAPVGHRHAGHHARAPAHPPVVALGGVLHLGLAHEHACTGRM